ncbi:6,7-dimethyl-8-ribityllumazine synthase [Inquilinus limosus]|uniref:6,7-dimethyl-8-ribityllumazine synthase n=1 Tax=Inquilinus limosus TaxID=171674 RepID=UPI003F186D7D
MVAKTEQRPVSFAGPAPHILIVEARFYEDIADELARGAVAVLDEIGATYERIAVPGALEIPAAVQIASTSARRFDGYVALGCVIRGETSHYDIVCNESARGLQELSLRHGLAIGNGILTVENEAQAWARAKVEEMDKGGGAARAALAMIELKRHFKQLTA